MKRRDLLKHATLAVTGAATIAFAIAGEAPIDGEPSQTHPIGKIALEEQLKKQITTGSGWRGSTGVI